MSLTTDLFGSSGPVKNYFNFIGNFEVGNTFSLFNTTLTGVIPTGTVTAGASSFTTFGLTSSSPLQGTQSLQVAGTSVFTAGQGFISPAVTIDIEDRAKMLTGKFYYNVQSGTGNFSGSSANTFAVWIRDTANAAWIMPQGSYNLVQSSGTGYCTFTFQTPSNATSFQVAIICINAPTSAMSMLFDDFYLGPQTAPMGPAMTDWNSNYAFTFSPSCGTVTNNQLTSRRVGDSLEVWGTAVAGPTTNASIFYIQLPAGLSIDYTKISNSSDGTFVGSMITNYTGTNAINTTNTQSYLFVDGSTTNQIFTAVSVSTANNKATTGNSWVTGYSGQFYFKIPILGWSSNSAQSSDTDTRVCAAEVYATSGVNPGAGNPIIFPLVGKDTHGAYNASTGQYTAPVTGFYNISGGLATNSTGVYLYASVNGSSSVPSPSAPYVGVVGSNGFGNISGLVYALAGQTIDIRMGNSSATSVTGNISFNRLSGPAVVTATESVNMAAYLVSNFSSSTNAPIKYDTVDFDSHGQYSPSTGLYTVPVSGKYQITITLYGNSATNLYVAKNGTYVKFLGTFQAGVVLSATTLVSCNAGDTLAVWTSAAITVSGSSAPYLTNFTVNRIGN